MNQGLRRFIAYTRIFVLGVALLVIVLMASAFDLSSDVARLLAFGGLAGYALAMLSSS